MYCSDGELTKEKCQTLIGYAMRHNSLYPSIKMVDPKMKSNSIESRYIGIFRSKKDDSIVRVNFTSNLAQSRVAFEATFKGREYLTALMAHTRVRWTGYYKSMIPRKLDPQRYNHDVYRLYAEYAQKKHDCFKGEGNRDEKSAGYITVESQKKAKDELAKKVRDLAKDAAGDRLIRQSLIFYIAYNKRYDTLTYGHWANKWSMKAAYGSLSTTLSNYIYSNANVKVADDIAWLIIDRRYGPQQCSEKEFTDKNCRIMMGYALRQNWLFGHKNMTDIRAPGNSERSQYIAYTWN